MDSGFAGIRVGVSQVDITPPAGLAMTGYIARLGNAVGAHDPLYARGLVFDDGQQRAALISCDVLAFDRHFVAATRSAIERRTGFPGANVLIACTHTHAGPATIFLRDCGEVDRAWMEELRRRLVAVLAAALEGLQPARVGFGRGYLADHSQNRRQPGDVMDPEVGVLRVDRTDGRPLAIALNFACHPTTLGPDNLLYSADYPGYTARQIEAATGATALFLTGAIGDVGPVQVGDYAAAETLGIAVADAALAVLPKITCQAGARVAVASEMLELPLLPLPSLREVEQVARASRAHLQAAEAAGEVVLARIHRAMLGWAEDTLAGLRLNSLARAVAAEVQVIRVGDGWLVGVPGELFVELGLAIKRGLQPHPVFICGYANDDIGYLPARSAYARGGYEVNDAYKYYGYPAALAPEAGEAVVAAALRLAARVS